MIKFCKKPLITAICLLYFWISTEVYADVSTSALAFESSDLDTSSPSDGQSSGSLSVPQVESVARAGASHATARADHISATVFVEATSDRPDRSNASAVAYIYETLYFINESADSSKKIQIPYELSWSSSVSSRSVLGEEIVGNLSLFDLVNVSTDTMFQVANSSRSQETRRGILTLDEAAGRIRLFMNIHTDHTTGRGSLAFSFPEGMPEGVIFVSKSGYFLDSNAAKNVWLNQGSGLFNNPNNWLSTEVPGEGNQVILQGSFSPDTPTSIAMPSSPLSVDSVTAVADDITLNFFEPLNSTSVFSINNQLKISKSRLRVNAIPGSNFFDTYVRLQLLGGLNMLNSELMLGTRTALSGLNNGEIEIGNHIVLKGDGGAATDGQLPTIEASTRLLPWGAIEPIDTYGVPQLEVREHGRVLGNLINEGWLTLDEAAKTTDDPRFIVEGNYTQTDTGVLEVTLGYPDGFKGFNTPLSIKGKAVIDGTLRITLKEGYQPKPGDYFTIMSAEGGIDLGGGLRSDGGALDETISQRGFKEIEGIWDADYPNTFWGVDYNQRSVGEHTIQVVALSVPKRVVGTSRSSLGKLKADSEFLTPSVIQNRAASNLIITSHGTTHYSDLSGKDSLGEIAIGMHALAKNGGLDSKYDIIAVDWSQFATNPLDVVGALVANQFCLAHLSFAQSVADFSLDKGLDSRGRSFDPYETARFSQQYARSLLVYLKRVGYEVGGLESLHTIGHSSGAYMADAIFDVLLQPEISPFRGDKPLKNHLTLLDAYLPPAKGGVKGGLKCFLTPWSGEALGELGDIPAGSSTNQIEHYFNDDVAAGTNNAIHERLSPDVVTFEVSDYLLKPRSMASGHSVPIEFYRDSIYAHLDEPLILNIPQNGLHSYVLNNEAIDASMKKILKGHGAAFSPLLIDLGMGASLEDTLIKAAPDDLSQDGDIDVVVPELRKIITAIGRWGTNSALITSFDSSGTDVISIGNNAYRFSTSSPAISLFELKIDKHFDVLLFDAERVSGIGGNITVKIDGLVVGHLDFNADSNLKTSGHKVSYELYSPKMNGDLVSVEFVVNDTEEGQVVVDLSNMGFAILENTVGSENEDSNEPTVSSSTPTGGNSGGGSSTPFVILLLLVIYRMVWPIRSLM